jgi:hypothetical protein
MFAKAQPIRSVLAMAGLVGGSRLDDGAIEAAKFWETWLSRSGLRTP